MRDLMWKIYSMCMTMHVRKKVFHKFTFIESSFYTWLHKISWKSTLLWIQIYIQYKKVHFFILELFPSYWRKEIKIYHLFVDLKLPFNYRLSTKLKEKLQSL